MILRDVLIKDLIEDLTLYPRDEVNWMTIVRYKDNMQTGSIFPPVIVAKYKNKFVLIDGFHRVAACRRLNIERIKAEVFRGLTKEQMYLKGVEANAKNARPFSSKELRQIVLKCRNDYKMPDNEISMIVCIPEERLSVFMADRLAVTQADEVFVLKSQLKHLAGTTVSETFQNEQRIYSAHCQLTFLEEFIYLLEHNHLDLKNEEIKEKVDRILKLLKEKIQLLWIIE